MTREWLTWQHVSRARAADLCNQWRSVTLERECVCVLCKRLRESRQRRTGKTLNKKEGDSNGEYRNGM
jgi:hypothetical protein